jgi:hypothetical protein
MQAIVICEVIETTGYEIFEKQKSSMVYSIIANQLII